MVHVMIAADDLGYGIEMTGVDPASMGDALRDVMNDALSDPMRLSAWLSGFALAEQNVGLNMLRRFSGQEPIVTIAHDPSDKRFSEAEWRANPMLAGVVEEFRIRSQAAMALIDGARVPDATRRKARFAMQLMLDAASPSNVPWLNPGVIKEAVDTNGASLLQGMQNFMDDLRDNGGYPRQVDAAGFEVGKNIAATPGRVVMRNDLIELIAYEPQTPNVHAVPMLFSPPWINKYYIMDLSPGRSFVEWAVRHGHQVFAISYRNPDASMSHYKMDDYLRLGFLAAIDAVQEITGSKQVNVSALCLGGTLALIGLAYLAAKGQGDRVKSATVTNTLIDFSIPGDLGIFTDEATIDRLERRMRKRGYLDSAEMAKTFDWMRSQDLIWSYVINSWYKGKRPPAFDILAWNGDSTRMPVEMHSQYLRSCYLHNAIVRPGAFSIDGTPIDLGKIKTPLYVLGAENDHIAPWHATYLTTQHVGGPSKYVLTNAGHIAGIVNPPGGKKSMYYVKPQAIRGESADEWLATADRHAGSWWEDWAVWAGEKAGPEVAPYALPTGEAAPGKYVRNEIGEPFGVAKAATS
jgi:polyhydroxyalkanoate synthase subunit PhaC